MVSSMSSADSGDIDPSLVKLVGLRSVQFGS